MYIVDFAKNLFRKANVGVIVYLVINILLYVGLFGGFSNPGMAGVALLLYLVTLCIALSPVGEFIMRMQNGCRKIKRKEYMDRLLPLFNEVYAQAKAADPSISDHVQFFMSDSGVPNAFATGRKTICITKGFLNYRDEQIKGTLAHEFAHLAHKDTDLLLLISVGNMLLSAIFLVWRIIINILVAVFASALHMRFIGTFLTSFFINLLLTFGMWCWTKLGMLLVMHSSRQNEYEADAFAFRLGYGNELCAVLDSLGGDAGAEAKSLWSQLRSTHPPIDDRIARLQEMGSSYTNAYGGNAGAMNAKAEQYGYQSVAPPQQDTGFKAPPQVARHQPQPQAAVFQSPPQPAAHQPPQQAAVYQQPPQVAAGYQQPPQAAAGYQQPAQTAGYQQPAQTAGYQQPPQQAAGYQQPVQAAKRVSFPVGAAAIASPAAARPAQAHVTLRICEGCKAELKESEQFCPYCGKQFTEPAPQPAAAHGACARCGSALDPGAAFCSECGSPVAQIPAACRSCGAELEKGAAFCSDCGARAG